MADTPIEAHFTVYEIAERWKISVDTAQRLFINEDGVLRIGNPSRLVKKKYVCGRFKLRIPESVFLRVQDRLMNKRGAQNDPDVLRGRGRRGNGGLHAS